jgi:Endosomal/lysosomal potassium channel TMEM175
MSNDRGMPRTPTSALWGEQKLTADRITAFSDTVFAVIVTIMVLELSAPDQPAFSALWPLVAHGHKLCSKLPVHRHYLDKPKVLRS